MSCKLVCFLPQAKKLTNTMQAIAIDCVGFCCPGDFGFLVTPVSRTSVLKDAVYYLPCVAFSRSGQEINITWSSDGSEIPSDDVFVSEKSITRDGVYVLSSVLEIKCPTFEDELSVHTYTCSATDGMESDSASTDLQLQFIPDTTTTTTTTTTSRSKSISSYCKMIIIFNSYCGRDWRSCQ